MQETEKKKDGKYRLIHLVFHSGGYTDEPDFVLANLGYPHEYSSQTLCGAIQGNCTMHSINGYLQSYEHRSGFKETFLKDTWPALYYAVERNSPELVSLLLQLGLDPGNIYGVIGVPLIAFAIIHGHQDAVDTTDVVRELLAFGVDPNVIPKDMWIQVLEAPRDTPPDASMPAKSAWCTPAIRPILTESLNLTQRYLLHLANELETPNPRTTQIAQAHKMFNLAKLPYYLIGQQPATTMVMNQVYAHIALRKKTPLVMAFVGPSGHGKTELARAMGKLLSVETKVVDCAAIKSVWSLFGMTLGYENNQKGSPVNNFLADNSAKCSVVVLDELDKTEREVRDAILVLTDRGEYIDRRSNQSVDCSRTIWIIAANAGSDTITEYYSKKLENLQEDKLDRADMTPLQVQLTRIYKGNFGAPFTGRISLLVPFLPFTLTERAVVLHKFILDFATSIRTPIDLHPNVLKFIGHCSLTIVDDGKVCVKLSQAHYDTELGARSLKTAAEKIEQQLVSKHNSKAKLVTEGTNTGPRQNFIVRRVPVGNGDYTIGVFAAH